MGAIEGRKFSLTRSQMDVTPMRGLSFKPKRAGMMPPKGKTLKFPKSSNRDGKA
jgi:hypothetical protein